MGGEGFALRGAQRLLPYSWERKQSRSGSDADRAVDWPGDHWQGSSLVTSVLSAKVMGKGMGEAEGEGGLWSIEDQGDGVQ